MVENKSYYKAYIEALLFVSTESIPLPILSKMITLEIFETRELIDELILDYSERNGGIELREIAGGYQLVVKPEFVPNVSNNFQAGKKESLTRSSLETLSIIAYKQPITLQEVDEIRGVSSRGVLNNLLEKKLVKSNGQKQIPGRPSLFVTTKEFLIYFGLNKISDLPEPKELQEIQFDKIDDLIE